MTLDEQIRQQREEAERERLHEKSARHWVHLQGRRELTPAQKASIRANRKKRLLSRIIALGINEPLDPVEYNYRIRRRANELIEKRLKKIKESI